MNAKDATKNLYTFGQEFKEHLHDEVRKELGDELADEMEDVEYDEVPLEGESPFVISSK